MDTIYSLFQKVVKEHENAPAIIENDRTMTFGELSNMVDMITCSFPQEVHSIGIVMRHRTEMIASILAVLKCGGRYVPAEPDFPTGRIHDMMTEAQVDFVLTEHAFAPKLSSFPIRYTDCEICGVETPSWKRNAIEDRNAPPMCCIRQVPPGGPKVSVSPTAMFAIMSVPLPTSSIPAPVMSCCNIPSVLLTSLWRKCSPVC